MEWIAVKNKLPEADYYEDVLFTWMVEHMENYRAYSIGYHMKGTLINNHPVFYDNEDSKTIENADYWCKLTPPKQ